MTSVSNRENQMKRFFFPKRYPAERRRVEPMQRREMEELLQSALAVSDKTWGWYYLYKDPMRFRITREEGAKMVELSMECARETCQKMPRRYSVSSLRNFCAQQGIQLTLEDTQQGIGALYLSTYMEGPDRIQVYTPMVKKIAACLVKNGLGELQGFQDFCEEPERIREKIIEIMIAHEVFHYMEAKDKNIYTREKHVENFRLGPWKSRATVMGTGEIAAHYFAKLYTGCEIHPAVLEIICFCIDNPKDAAGVLGRLPCVEQGFPI